MGQVGLEHNLVLTMRLDTRAFAQRVLQLFDQVAHVVRGTQRSGRQLTRHEHDPRARDTHDVSGGLAQTGRRQAAIAFGRQFRQDPGQPVTWHLSLLPDRSKPSNASTPRTARRQRGPGSTHIREGSKPSRSGTVSPSPTRPTPPERGTMHGELPRRVTFAALRSDRLPRHGSAPQTPVAEPHFMQLIAAEAQSTMGQDPATSPFGLSSATGDSGLRARTDGWADDSCVGGHDPQLRRSAARVVIAGRPGAGKGTQGTRLARRLGVRHLSTGDLLRDAIAIQSSLGRAVERLVRAGRLVPTGLIVAIVESNLDTGGYVLDGFPRTVVQAEALFERDAFAPNVTIEIVVPTHIALAPRGRPRPDGRRPPCRARAPDCLRRRDAPGSRVARPSRTACAR